MHDFDAIQRLATQHEIFKRLNFMAIVRRTAAGTNLAKSARQTTTLKEETQKELSWKS
jgi:hypothetical protein